MIRTCSVLVLALFLGGCLHTSKGLPPSSRAPICEALMDPIRYNSKNKKSLYYAGKKLAPELAKRNRVAINLGCKKYRTW